MNAHLIDSFDPDRAVHKLLIEFTGIDEDELQELNQLSQEEHEKYFETFFINGLSESSESTRLYCDINEFRMNE